MKMNKATAKVARPSVVDREKGIRLQTEMVVRENVLIPFAKGHGQTLGQMLDRQLSHLAKEDGEMRAFNISFDDDSWKEAKEFYKDWEEPYTSSY